MRGNTDWANARAAAAMRDAKGFMQIEMADIGTKFRRGAMANKRIQIGAIDIDLPTCLVHNFTKICNGFFKHTMR